MKVHALLHWLQQMPPESDIVLRDPRDPSNSIPLYIDGFTKVRSIDPPSHLILTAPMLEVRDRQREQYEAALADPRRA